MKIEKDHIPYLAEYFVRKYCQELACPQKIFTKEVVERLKKYPWPGEVEELERVMKRAVVLAPRAEVIRELEFPTDQSTEPDMEDISLEEIVRKKLTSFFSKWEGYEMSDLHDEVLKRVEKPLLELILKKTKGNQVRAAKILGINRNTLHKKLNEMGIGLRRANGNLS
jgi:two-component system, NtrC family, nitrogen regulation response regulator GlnG